MSDVPSLPPHLTQSDVNNLNAGCHDRPFDMLGVHRVKGKSWLVALVPGAARLTAKVGRKKIELDRVDGALFAAEIHKSKSHPILMAEGGNGESWSFPDPYSFGPVLGELDLHLIGEGTHRQVWSALGAHVMDHEGVAGTHFAVWAPNAKRVSVVGDFNGWNGTVHPMRRAGGQGVWEIFLPNVGDGTRYKYELLTNDGLLEKADPMGFGAEHPPATASVVRDIADHTWDDLEWIETRAAAQARDKPISIYEVHLGSWRRTADGGRMSYVQLAKDLVEYATWMGFTHLEFLPVTEFPFDGSWGYQPVGLYAPTIRFGPPDEFRALVTAAHQAGLGVILDWVPGHFPSDAHGLAKFDGTHLYEHADPREGFHQDWNTLIYNYGRNEVRNYLTANATYWLSEYHIDGLRVDAVASMLYRDYSREDGQWVPNKDGGRENYEAIDFLKEMNVQSYGQVPGIITVAEESTAFPGVSTPVDAGGLGFGYKWNMGWMNDTLRYMETDPVHRKYDHHLMTAPIDWSYTENFILPISHDEVVHGKGSMIDKMPGNEWEKFANLRAYYGYMWGHPGKKLLFMGCEFGQWHEWNHDEALDWDAVHGAHQSGLQRLVRDLNHLYRDTPALHTNDCARQGFQWLMNDPDQSVTAFARFGNGTDAPVVVVCNFTPVERVSFRIPVPGGGSWDEVINTDAENYGGGNRGNLGGVVAIQENDAYTLEITLPPLATLVFRQG